MQWMQKQKNKLFLCWVLMSLIPKPKKRHPNIWLLILLYRNIQYKGKTILSRIGLFVFYLQPFIKNLHVSCCPESSSCNHNTSSQRHFECPVMYEVYNSSNPFTSSSQVSCVFQVLWLWHLSVLQSLPKHTDWSEDSICAALDLKSFSSSFHLARQPWTRWCCVTGTKRC